MSKPVLYIDGEALDMGGLPSITIERHNPLLSEGQQSYSYPFTIPGTPHNDRLLGFPRRYMRKTMGNHSWTCTLVCGARVRVGRLVLNSINATSYDCSMIYDTAQLLDKTKGMKLGEVFGDKIAGAPFGNIEAALAYLQRLFSGQETSVMFSVFTLLVDVKTYTVTGHDGAHDNYWYCFLNMPDNNGVLNDKYRDIKNKQPYLPSVSGFGIAPFLRAKFLIEYIVEQEGYTLDWGNRTENPIDELVVLHNRMDVLADNGVLKYRQLCPDCTVDEFFAAIEGMFCAKFILNSKTKTVTFRLFNDELDYNGARPQPPYPYPDTKLNGSYKQPKLELMPHSLAPPKLEFIPKRAIKLCVERNMSVPTMTSQDAVYYKRLSATDEELIYYQAVQSSASIDVNLPCEYLKNCGIAQLDTRWYNSIVSNVSQQTFALAYLFGTSYDNSVAIENDEVKEDKKVKTPLAFAYEFFSTYYNSRFIGVVNKIECFAENTMSLRLHNKYTLDGLFNVYYYLRDQMLRNGGYHATLPVSTAIVVDENEQYLLNGQPMMVETVTEVLGENESQEVKLQTIKNYT